LKLTVDFTKKGLDVFFKPYERDSLLYLLKNRKGSYTDVHKYIVFFNKITKMSVHNFLIKMVKIGLLSRLNERGTIKYIMYPTLTTEKQLLKWVISRVIKEIE
jgi:predicted transcriptional regulator